MTHDTRSDINRRQFIQRAALTGAAVSVISALHTLETEASPLQALPTSTETNPLDLAAWTYFWVGVRRAKLAKGTLASGEQMYVESLVPAQVRHPFSSCSCTAAAARGWTG